MKKCLIVGGGFSGLAAAVYLSNNNYQVELIESSPKLGGRAYSFTDKNTNSILDNGQHILMGCYKETLRFLNLINSKDSLNYQKSMEVNFLDNEGKLHQLKTPRYFYPFNLLIAILDYKALPVKDRYTIIKFCIKLFLTNPERIGESSVTKWLENEGQHNLIRKSLWEIMAVGALNCNMDDASPKIFGKILKQIFFTGNHSATIIIPAIGLSQVYCDDAVNFIKNKAGSVSTSETVQRVIVESDRVKSVITNKREIDNFDFVLFTIPPFAITRIEGVPNAITEIAKRFKYSSILTFHIWIKNFKMVKPFYGLIDSRLHWVFDHGNYVTTVISDANNLINKGEQELFEIVKSELKKYLNISDENIIDYKILKDKRSTFIPSPEIINIRPDSKTVLKNLFLAGDWINTKLPSTIEGAVVSARVATEAIMSSDNN
jgi:squalene-associated FAD-dependent desaturase